MRNRLSWILMFVVMFALSSLESAKGQQTASEEEDLKALAEELEAAEAEEEASVEERDRAAKDTMDSYASRARRQALEARERLIKDPLWRPTHEQVDRIELSASLNNICLDTQGRILACCGDKKLRVLSSQGDLVETWPLTFVPEAVAVRASDGAIFVGGQGQMARFGAHGELQQKTAFPPPPSEEDVQRAIDQAVKQMESQYKEMQQISEGIKRELEAVREKIKESPLTEDEQKKIAAMDQPELFTTVEALSTTEEGISITFKKGTSLGIRARMLEEYQKMLGQVNVDQQRDQLIERARQQAKQSVTSRFTGLAVADNDLFLICSGAGYSYNAWRMTHDFADPQMIISGMSGCCGQLDCQTHDGNLWLAMNTQHKVLCYDREGNLLSSFGKNDGQAADGFGGCCEPKNLRFAPDGKYVYCAQSGPPVCVKRFSLEGEFQDVVCFPVYETGCVRVSVDTAGGVFYLMSPNENSIYVFKPSKS